MLRSTRLCRIFPGNPPRWWRRGCCTGIWAWMQYDVASVMLADRRSKMTTTTTTVSSGNWLNGSFPPARRSQQPDFRLQFRFAGVLPPALAVVRPFPQRPQATGRTSQAIFGKTLTGRNYFRRRGPGEIDNSGAQCGPGGGLHSHYEGIGGDHGAPQLQRAM